LRRQKDRRRSTYLDLPALAAVSPMGHQYSGDGVSKLMLEFKVSSNAKSGASWRRRIRLPYYLDQQRRASWCSTSHASGCRVAVAGSETYDNWHSTSRRASWHAASGDSVGRVTDLAASHASLASQESRAWYRRIKAMF
jgi:hypothetical protein